MMKQPLTFYKELEYTPDIHDVIKQEAEQTIALYVKNVPAQMDLEEFYASLARKIGFFSHIDENPMTGEVSPNTWTEIRYVEEKRHLAYKYSDQSHLLHTDYCYIPRDFIDLEWTCLFCKTPATIGGATIAVDPLLLIDILQTWEPGLYDEIIHTPVIFERPGAICGTNSAKIIDFDEVGPLFCWSNNRISKSNTEEAITLCKHFHEFLEAKVIRGGLAVPVNLRSGEALIFQDKRFLHGRNGFYGNRFLKKTPIVKHNIGVAQKLVKKMVAEQ